MQNVRWGIQLYAYMAIPIMVFGPYTPFIALTQLIFIFLDKIRNLSIPLPKPSLITY